MIACTQQPSSRFCAVRSRIQARDVSPTGYTTTARLLRLLVMGSMLLACAQQQASPGTCSKPDRDWPVYGGSKTGDRYSDLKQIDRKNVAKLAIAWRYETGEGGLQTSPLVIGQTLYAYTPKQQVIALDPANGNLKWQFDPASIGQTIGHNVSHMWGDISRQPVRGLTYWREGSEQRLLASGGTYLYALDPATGAPISTFGSNGRVDLREGLGRDPLNLAVFLTSPGIIYEDLIIVGFRTSETKPAAPGAVRAYDVRTGKLRWIFNLIPRPGEPGHDTWPKDAWKSAGGANAWAGFALDEKRGIVYIPTGSAVDDFFGADRAGNNVYANSLVALDAATGKYIWHFQAVHHDLWDWDLPSPPILLTIKRDGRSIDAVAQLTKHGFVFVFDRVTGAPLFPIEERPVPQTNVPGEQTSPTQPFPLKPLPFARQRLSEELITTRTSQAHAEALRELKTFRTKGLFTPLTLGQQTVVFPSFDGGAEWGGAAADRQRGVIYVNAIDIVSLGGLADSTSLVESGKGAELYQAQCVLCHGLNREGSPPQFPSLIKVAARLKRSQISEVIVNGRGRMPGFPQLNPQEIDTLTRYLSSDSEGSVSSSKQTAKPPGAAAEAPKYLFTGYRKFLDADGYPAVNPPWGTLNAIDLNTGEYLWRIPLGEYPELAAEGFRDTGTENYGGPLVTASDLLFIGATIYDRKFRAFDSRTGKKLWETELPFAGNATPITYMISGRQYIVIACSGSRNPKGPQGSSYVAFALPR